ncbi:GW dipeptide domain-containing protein [Leuconostoc suionicum]|uniref:GW dipeptide domain-containing protein n=1 Tax=Leuconostoc suionicum TaxID=1511761 RepID=UPI0024ADC3DB|nr:GW dipeptide domain-containing protein [Leuconostoc suionicum]MDI6498403.1 GW dipeptide domain-containing protein [Leuconostoc suionicum]MDI6500445.1 GW dipeptide domain-containing protein [Leuconostoc suionicum]MDI6502569.1 GW dipeptide domain-containing protein [Leuconostoc suionicum]MDI6665429.1 GW dipeptide domain-containing protein [Leuconostoc suionicum]
MNHIIMKSMILVPLTIGVLTMADYTASQYKSETTVSAATVNNTITSIDLTIDQTGRDDGFWTKPYGQEGAEFIGNLKNYQGNVISSSNLGQIVQQGVTTWRQVTINGKTGYVDINAFKDEQRAAVVYTDATKYQVSFNIYNGQIWSKPFGVAGATAVGKTNGDTKTYNVDKIAKVAYRGGSTQWVHLQGYGWVDRQCTCTAYNMAEVDSTLFGRYGMLPRNFNVFSVYGTQLNNATTQPTSNVYFD